MKQAKRLFAVLLAVVMMACAVPVGNVGMTASAASSYTLNINWDLIGEVGYQTVSGPCAAYSLAYCRTILDGYSHQYTEYYSSGGCVWSRGNYATVRGGSAQGMLRGMYDRLNNNSPVVAHLLSNSGTQHWVAVVGYQNVTDPSNLSIDNFLMIDPGTSRFKNLFPLSYSYRGYSLHGDYRYAYTDENIVPPSPPTWATLSIDKEEVRCGETFTFTMNSDATIDYYWFTILRASNNEQIVSESTNGIFSSAFLSCDHYYAWCSAANSKGSVDSNRVDFYVYGDAPTEGHITVDQARINLGESVSLSISSNAYYTRNYVAIFDADGNKCLEGWKENTFSFTPSKAGTYSAYASLHTVDGGIDTPWINFSVSCINHTWNSGTVTKAATCSAAGTKTFTCTVCNATKTESIAINPSNHVNTTNIAATPSTCTVKGYTAGVYCNDCEKYISGHQEQPLAAHTLTTVNQRAATCTAEGYTGDQFCTICQQTITTGTTIGKTAHTLTTINQRAATCTAEGYTGDEYCTVCKQTISTGATVEKKAHTITVINQKDATYDAEGYTGDEYCTTCHQVIKAGTVIQKLERPAEPQPENLCHWCGQVHEGFFGGLTAFFHNILAAILGARY